MASIRKRGNKWQVQVRKDGHPPLSRTFSTRDLALRWARDKEREIERGELPATIRQVRGRTLSDLLRRYRDEVTPTKRGAASERCRIGGFMADPIASVSLDRLSAVLFSDYRDRRLKVAKPGTVRRELVILRHCLEVARREWGVPLRSNPIAAIKVPACSEARQRRLESDELARLLTAMESRRVAYMRPLLLLAIETGMRRSELLALRWRDVDLERRVAFLPMTKNGDSRNVPLSKRAVELLSGVPRTDARVFPVTGNAVRLAWERLRYAAGVDGLRFHDLRHEAVSRFFEKGLSVPEAALASGHRDLRMLARYTHLRPEAVAAKLD